MSTEQSDPWIGTTVDGRYEIEDRVARGGMSTVYLARDARLGRHVALKVLFPHLAEDRKVVERFEQEARNAALISHPHVVQVLDQGQTRETAYLVMEHVPGATLRTLLKRGPMTPRLALTYTEAILHGLGAAHRAGLVHRDIKPENVLVSRDGRIKLADFGLARAATHHSGTSTLMGTVAYISPELLSGEGADERADIYAVGILLYEMLTGVQPYTGDSPVRVAFQHVNSTVPAPSAAVPGLSPALDEVVRSATRPAVEERPKHADELLALVRRCRAELREEDLDHIPPQEHPAGEETHDGGTPDGTAVLPGAEAGAAPAEQRHAAAAAAAGQASAEGGLESADEGATAAWGPQEEFPTRVEADAWDDDVAAALLHARAGSTLEEDERQTVAEVPTEAFRSPDPGQQHAPWQGPVVSHEPDGAVGAPEGDDATTVLAAAPGPDRPPGTEKAPAGPTDALHRPVGSAAPSAEETSEFSAVGPLRPLRRGEQESREDEPAPGRGPAAWVRRRGEQPGDERRRRQRPTVELSRPTPTRTWLTIAVVMICTALLVLFAWYLGLSPEIIPSLGHSDASELPTMVAGALRGD
ncbi:protein kinase domain-containing protein [Nesterenkonia sp. HG001]|nr:protein kinase [Nesterenkonia sp. HG001]MDZ5075987.1 protein kinase [Nesterenkonia sp. HG001]